jgi:hypothetical protein
MVFNSARSEGQQLYSQIKNLTIPNGTLNGSCSKELFWLNGSFFSGDYRDIRKGEVKT